MQHESPRQTYLLVPSQWFTLRTFWLSSMRSSGEDGYLWAWAHRGRMRGRITYPSICHTVTVLGTDTVTPTKNHVTNDKLTDSTNLIEFKLKIFKAQNLWRGTYQIWNCDRVHSNLWSQCLNPEKLGKRILNSSFGVVTITSLGFM